MIAASVVCVLIAYGSNLSAMLYAAGFLAVLPTVSLVMVRMRRRRLSVVRAFSPSLVPAGSIATVDLAVRNLSVSRSGPAVWADRIPWRPGTAGPGELPSLAGSLPGYVNSSAAATLRYTVRPPFRGVFNIGPLEVEYTDPFGLAAGSASLGGIQPLSVVPIVIPLGGGGPSILAGDGTARLAQRRAAGNDDDLMTREYRSGDALRRIHWRASARHGELMVRQEEQRTYPEARILIDTRKYGYRDEFADLGNDDSGSGAFEWAVRMVASLGVHLHRTGFLVQVLETGPAQITPLGDANQGAGQDIDFLISLAGLRLSDAPLPGAGLIRGEEQAEGLPGPIFAVVADPDLATLHWIAAQRRPFELGVAFVLGRRSASAFDALSAAGWTCVPVRETDDPALAWASISRFTGQATGGGR